MYMKHKSPSINSLSSTLNTAVSFFFLSPFFWASNSLFILTVVSIGFKLSPEFFFIPVPSYSPLPLILEIAFCPLFPPFPLPPPRYALTLIFTLPLILVRISLPFYFFTFLFLFVFFFQHVYFLLHFSVFITRSVSFRCCLCLQFLPRSIWLFAISLLIYCA